MYQHFRCQATIQGKLEERMQRRLLLQGVDGKGFDPVHAAQHFSLYFRSAVVVQATIHDIRDAAEPRCI